MLSKVRPNILILGIVLAGVTVYALYLGHENVALAALGGLIGAISNLQDHN